MDTPIRVKCLRRRCRVAREYIAIRGCPVRVVSVDPGDAPLALIRPEDQHFTSGALRDVRLVDGRWFEPMSVEREGARATPEGLSRAVVAAMDGTGWGDWPFTVPRDETGRHKLETVRDADLDVSAWECDYDALANKEAAKLSTCLAIVGGTLHREVATPEILVKAESDKHPSGTASRPTALRVAHGCHAGGSVAAADVARGTLSVQRWSPSNAAAAERFLEAYASMTGTRVVRQRPWRPGPALGLLARDDVAAHDADLAVTLRESHQTHVGRMKSEVVRLWLRARDTADQGAFGRLPGEMSDIYNALGDDPCPWAKGMRAKLLPDLLRMALERPTSGITVGRHGAGVGDGHGNDDGMETFNP